ncbi:MAG: hypothetical protein M3O31_04320 [Acidobacteriota bacterium]|nr:hypothetical protein [Acidobacteriota bacterium]
MKTFLEDFSHIFTDLGDDKAKRSEGLKIAAELFANKLAHGKEEEKRSVELGNQKSFTVQIDQRFDAPLRQAQHQSGETRKQWVEKAIDDRLNQPKAEPILIADFSGIIGISPRLDGAALEIFPRTTFDDEQCPLPLDERAGQDVGLREVVETHVTTSGIRLKLGKSTPRGKKASGSQPGNLGFDFEHAAS